MRRLVFTLLAASAVLSLDARAAISASTPPVSTTMDAEVPWWTHAVIYEIYPRSFQDTNGDGIGDLNGITQRLDYLQALGVDAIWISPFYPSPQVDFGYDISDYEAIDPQYGTLADLDRLIAEGKKRHIRVLLDMVLNHTSDQHPWFRSAASSASDPKHDWYVWNAGRRGAGGQPLPPNNWTSIFGHSAWSYVPAVGEFYYHRFYPQQPDLNWRNPAVEAAMFSAMRFWLDRGVAGFRLDAIPELFEDPALRNERVKGGRNAFGDPELTNEHVSNLPEVHDVIRRMRSMVDAYPDQRVLIGETYLPNVAALDRWYGGARHDELQLPMDMALGFAKKLDASAFRRLLEDVETRIHGSTPLLVFDNHDNPRSWNRFADGVHDSQIARLIAALLLTSRGTALMYYGQEIGMPTTTPVRVEDVKDPIGVTGWPKEKGRDGERTPMQWDASNEQAGFSDNGQPWLPVPANYRTLNVEAESRDPKSLLSWYKALISLRRTQAALNSGSMVMLNKADKAVLSYARVAPQGAIIVALNMSAEPRRITVNLAPTGVHAARLRTVLDSTGTSPDHIDDGQLVLAPYGTWVGATD